jgi:DNA-binding NarL/FixJ family response regulator
MRINAAGFVLKSDIAEALIPAVHAAIRDEKFMSNELVRSLFRDKFKK